MNHGTQHAYDHLGCRCIDCAQVGALRRRRGLPEGDTRHGSENGYGNFGCRCQACRSAHSATVAARKAQRQPLAADDPRHGTYNAYVSWDCRCGACRAAQAEYARNYRQRSRA
jgi:hypothetical protein